MVTIVTGLGLLAAGIVFLPAPGPGTVILALGAGILAREALWMAKALDWAELRARGALKWFLGVWRRAGPLQRAGLIALKLALTAGVAYLGWRVAFGD